MDLPLLILKRVTGPLTSLLSLSQSKWWSGSQGSIYGLILPLPCLPRTFMYLNLELHSDIFISHSRRMPLPVYSPWTFFFALGTLNQLLVFDKYKFSLDCYLPSIANVLSLALLSLCTQSYVVGTLSSFSWLFSICCPSRENWFHCIALLL